MTVVLPVRGCRSHSVANWEAILNLDYGALNGLLIDVLRAGSANRRANRRLSRRLSACPLPPLAGGALEFVFVLQDKSDPAHEVIAQLLRQQQGRRPARIHSAGFAERTSQKIHK